MPYRTTSPELIAQVLVQFPTIPFHTCRNERGLPLVRSWRNTSLSHLLEHLFDIQTRAHAEREDETTDPVFTGTTQWSATMRDVAIVRVSFYDDHDRARGFQTGAPLHQPRARIAYVQNDNQRDVNKPMRVMFFDSRLMRSVYNRTQPAFGKRPQGIAPQACS